MPKLLLLLIAVTLFIADPAVAAPPAPLGGRMLLPQDHPYQQQLRKFLAAFKAEDFEAPYQDLKVVQLPSDADEKFRTWILALMPPAVGRKRNHSSARIKAVHFTLDAIEGPKAILRPPAHPEPLVDLAGWNYPGNPYFNSRPLRVRAFVLVALDMIMLDKALDGADDKSKPHQNELACAIGRFAYVYPGIRELLPPEVQAAYLTGLKKLVYRLLEIQPKEVARAIGQHTSTAYALSLAARALQDPNVTKDTEAYVRPIFTDKRFYSKAGYFPSGGTIDSFNGISTYYAVWGALASDWPFVRDAVASVYRLRSHLTLPEPDGVLVGPSHMAALTSAEAAHEQWNWPMRNWGAALVADDAACLTKMPTDAEIQNAVALAVGEINAQLHELSWMPGGLDPSPWKNPSTGNLVNFAFQNYPRGYHSRRIGLEKQGNLARLPVLRDGSFVRRFHDEFLVAKSPAHAAVVYTGPIADPSNRDPGYGLGGGALSAFWTRDAGSVILGRAVGAWSPLYKKSLDEWRSLPSHAASGITADGKVFTSAHIILPEVAIAATDKTYTVSVSGPVPPFRHSPDKRLAGQLDYARVFESTPTGVRITTTVKGDGKDTIAELYETLPVYLRDAGSQPNAIPTTIEFQVAGKWSPATEAVSDKVAAIRLTRFKGVVTITFDQSRRVKLAPQWADTYQTRAMCRNVLIDLLDNSGQAKAIKEERKLSYRIEAAMQ